MVVSHPLPNDVIELIAERFRTLSEPTRIKLLDRLREGEASVLELTELIGTTQQNLSKHLGVLQRGRDRRPARVPRPDAQPALHRLDDHPDGPGDGRRRRWRMFPSPVSMARNCSASRAAPVTLIPVTASQSMLADAWLIEQPRPVKPIAATVPPSSR